MKTIIGAELYTQSKRRVIMYRLNNQRYILAHHKNINAGTIVLILQDYFPGLVFIPHHGGYNSEISVARYFIQKHGKWILDLDAMSKSKEKIYSSLFPDNFSLWNEEEARTQYGRADIIRFFIDMENDAFLVEFSKLSEAARSAAKNLGKSVPIRFFDELNYNGKPVWKEWDFSALVSHRMRRRPPCIYEAFGYYARRLYTLMSFGLASPDNTDDGLISTGTASLSSAITEKLPETADYRGNRLTEFFEMIQKTLESVPAGGSLYVPAGPDVFINQLRTRIADLYKNSGFQKEEDTYNEADRKTINNHIEKAGEHAVNGEILSELEKVKLTGTYRDKINLLHRVVFVKPMSEHYSQRELDTIHGLFLKQYRPVSLDKSFSGGEDGSAFTGHDLVGEERYINAEDRLAWSSFFRDEFARQLNKDALEQFMEYIPDHFSMHPFDADSQGNLSMSKYSRKMLFAAFCSSAGIPPDDELRGPFMVLLKRVVDNINKSRTE